MRETADINEKNNVWPTSEWKEASKFSLFKAGAGNRRNPGGSGKIQCKLLMKRMQENN